MKSLNIQIFSHNVLESTIKIPIIAIQLLMGVVPKSIGDKLNSEGINLIEIVNSDRIGEFSGVILDCIDHKDDERVVISIS